MIASILLVAAIVDAIAERYPLGDAHWDAAIYLFRARSYAEGDVLVGFRVAANETHDAVMRGVYPTPYWSFMRVGQTVLLGTVVSLVGTGEGSIYVLTWLYRALLAIGLFLSAMLASNLVHAVRPGSPEARLYLGAIVSIALYVLSDVASYMSGNLVSEVPAIFLIAVSAWALVKSWATGSRLPAVVSGCAAFLLYVVRMESVWSYVSLLIAMGWLLTRQVPNAKHGWQTVATSAGVAACLFIAYSWIFYPLTDPRLAIRFSEATAKFGAAFNPALADTAILRGMAQMFSANGLLWVGAVLSLGSIHTNRACQFGAAWLVASLLPVAVGMAHAADTQTRMYTTLTPVLILLSTLGWTRFLARFRDHRNKLVPMTILTTCCLLVLVSQQASYGLLRELPGAWRLQYVRQYVAVMPFERINYRLPEMVAMARAIESQSGRVLLMASPGMQGADQIMLVQYLLPGEDRDGAEERPALTRGHDSAINSVRVRLSTTPGEDAHFLASLTEEPRVFLLGAKNEREWIRGFGCCGEVSAIAESIAYSLFELRRVSP